ncbi:regulator of nonsense transcripts 3B-like [Onthophagus taurus]|uniref:regulator of nonsense transcripts 3B-like n=1 Tax=Onthophagus taurus TaxID=166361 RepID=UPI000C209A5B|nr:regulator of nonsense transcripts 3B-like [Onthophagus taurus]
MALPENTSQEKPPNEPQKHEKREKPSTKVIVRRLPPSMTLEEFQTQVSPLPDYDYMYTVKGDMSLGENSFSRVYINFCNTEDIFMFKEKFDNYVFVDGKGHEYAAVVEFASFQKIPKKRGKPRPDPKLATIESDPTYIDFVESLKRQPNQDEKVEFSYQPSADNKNDGSTPLLDYIKQRKLDRLKSREEKREERRRREIERKKIREEEKRKRFEENSPGKAVTIKQSKTDLEKIPEEKKNKEEEKAPEKTTFKTKDFKVPNKTKPKYNKFEYEKRDYKSRTGYNRHYDDTRKRDESKKGGSKETDEQKPPTSAKKGKKYSERREERKMEVKKAEAEKEGISTEETIKKDVEEKGKDKEEKVTEEDKTEEKKEDKEKKLEKRSVKDEKEERSDDQDKVKNKENDPRVQRRIRNKDRPTMQLYQPGMLSKRRQQEDDKDVKEVKDVKENKDVKEIKDVKEVKDIKEQNKDLN